VVRSLNSWNTHYFDHSKKCYAEDEMKPTKSIITDIEDRCYLTGARGQLERHHIFGGNPNRKYSEQYGLHIMLTSEMHKAVHANKKLMRQLHEEGQRAFEGIYGTKEDFMKIFGRNYL
jgi:hypothetical protein